ncbi:helix-turn-helix domain-containing protein [Sphingomonas sp. CROZ-RG-20F-R02-07]|uniref:helix-turn-helix domain-containing protein n=1 Tax=Sphingomonas sp. CROZ-RG-20F-R02-07 TaxID=2914832 RepID=UPI001F588F2A|nr:helix-turn-helix domain-containing protein [Sphingomonas sp. CROZ-RG-20F-R02-07]
MATGMMSGSVADAGTWADAGTRGVSPSRMRDEHRDPVDRALNTTLLAEPIFARVAVTEIGALRMVEREASPRRSDRTPALIAHDGDDHIGIQLALGGASTGNAAGRHVASDPGTILILDFAQPFSVIDREPRHVIDVAIPRSMLASHVADLDVLHGDVIRPPKSDLIAATIRVLLGQAARPSEKAALTLTKIFIDLVLFTLDREPAAGTIPAPNRHATLIDQATKMIDARLGSDDLTPNRLVAQLKVSRSDLYAAFEPFGGVARFIWRRRLEASLSALTNDDDQRRISEIAFAYGFSSEAHFSRAFRRMFGRTASAVRKTALSANAVNHQSDNG